MQGEIAPLVFLNRLKVLLNDIVKPKKTLVFTKETINLIRLYTLYILRVQINLHFFVRLKLIYANSNNKTFINFLGMGFVYIYLAK